MANISHAGTIEATVNILRTKQLVDAYLRDFFTDQASQARTVSRRYEMLWTAAEKLALSGGKRLRPYTALLAYRAFADDANIDKILLAAVACELIHLAMLIHDDVIDRDFVRYGIDNVSGQYMKEYSDLPEVDQIHFANTAAILIGDALIAESHRLLAISSDDLVLLRKAQLAFSIAISHVVGGELIDTESSFRQSDDTHAITVARYKTASYSFIGPLSIGAHLAGADDDSVESLKQYADSLGIAFQLKDDLLGSFGDDQVTGKSNNTDLREGKRTYLIEQFDLHAASKNKREFYQLFGRPDIIDDEVNQLRNLIRQSGSIDRTEQAIADYASRAQSALTELNVTPEVRQEFEQLITVCIDREK